MLYVGIDLGTSSVKLIVIDENGDIKNTVSKEYPISFPKTGWSEQNPYDWYDKTIEGLKELLAGVDKSQVKGLSFGGQMHGLVVLDEEDKVIRPAILWNDGRTGKQNDYLNEVIGREKLSDLTANVSFAGFTAPKILWMRDNEPKLFEKIKKIMLPKDYLAYRFTGTFSTDVSDASGTLLFDVKNRCWSKEMCEICHVSADMLPEIYESYETIGQLKDSLCEELGVSGVTVCAGAGDNAAAAVGTGTVGENSCNVSLGTSGTIFIAQNGCKVDKSYALHSFDDANGKYHLMGCMLSAASSNMWWCDEILKNPDYASLQENITKLGENNVYYLPYLMGERSPHNDPYARGTFIGMSMNTTREDMTLAVLEGVAFGIRDSFEIAKALGADIKETMICGGGAKSALWRKIMANVLGIKVKSPVAEEGPSYGAAILAMVACGEYKNVEEACAKIVKIRTEVEPEADLMSKYEEKYKKFKAIYPYIKGVFREIAE